MCLFRKFHLQGSRGPKTREPQVTDLRHIFSYHRKSVTCGLQHKYTTASL